jgi:L-fuconolactonase
MEVVDAQIHVWGEDRPDLPWIQSYAEPRGLFLRWGPALTIDRAISSMDAVGVSAALLTTFLLYDGVTYAADAVRRYPDRFRLVTEIDLSHRRPVELIHRFHAAAEISALRLVFLTERSEEHYAALRQRQYDPLLDVASDLHVPVMLVVSGQVLEIAPIAERYPNLTFIVDHLGIVQGPHREQPQRPFARLVELLSLARYPNVAIKLSGVPTLSTQSFPYRDVWRPIRRVIDEFGPHRVMWGSDFSRTRPVHSYAEAVGYLRYSDLLTEEEKSLVLGASLRRILDWPRTDLAATSLGRPRPELIHEPR